MAATIQVEQVRETIPEGGHQVTTTVLTSTIIPKELFVFKASDDTFSHVATVSNLAYPVGTDPSFTHYRTAVVTREFTDVATAIDFASDVKRRLQLVTTAYTEDVAAFVGSETETITG